MLAAKGWRPELGLVSGRKLAPGGALLHDEDGERWPACTALILPTLRLAGSTPLEDPPASIRKYFGAGYVVRSKMVKLPPLALSEWSTVGPLASLDYVRRGEWADDYTHPFEPRRFPLFWTDRWPTVYRRGRALRIELGSGCTWNWRGIVSP